MTIAELLADLAARGITLWAQDDQLHYRAAKGALTPELRAHLRAQKAAILDFLQSAQVEEAQGAISRQATAVEETRKFPLSFAQERLWFLDQLNHESTTYIEHGATRFIGPFHVQALERSIREIVTRHDILRTAFVSEDGQPFQRVIPDLPIPLAVIDISVLPEERRAAEIQLLLDRMGRVPFDLSQPPLLRIVLLRLAPESHVVVITLHHIVSDGWSARIFFRELAALYNAFVQNQPSPLPPLPMQYADYALWQRRWLQGQRLQDALAYWRTQLAGAPDLLTLPTDYPRPPEMSYRGARHPCLLPAELVRALTLLSRRENVTLFMMLLAALQTLLMRYSGQEDIVVGTQFAARPQREMERLIGFFINTQALRTNLAGNPSFLTLLQRVRETCLGAFEHQELPFGQLVDALQPARDLSYTPLFQVLLLLQTGVQMVPFSLDGLQYEDVPVTRGSAKFDLNIELLETSAGLEGVIEYSTDLFSASTIQRFANHWRTLLMEIVAHPERRLYDLTFLTPEERHALLHGCNATRTLYADSPYIDELFAAQAARTPNAPAVIEGQEQLSYGELHARSSQLASYLRTLGVRPETPVALFLPRSIDMITALLAIVKAGGVYLPLDPASPPARLAWMLADAHASLVITCSSLSASITPEQPVRVMCLDREWPIIARIDRANEQPRFERSPDQLAYIIYTSGSTGQPKGVMVSQRGLANYVHWASRYYQVAAGQGSLLHTSLAFDLTVTSLFLPLVVGRPVVLVAEEGGVEELANMLQGQQQVSPLKITPAHLDVLRQLVSTADLHEAEHVLVLGGEALKGASVKPWRACAPGMRMINEYGPTETVVGCCIYELSEAESVGDNVPIGLPIANTQVFVLDAQRQPVPIGVPGELYIGGAGVARGYLHRPDLTADRFCPNPFSEELGEAGARLYRTGDRVRWLERGVLEFLGRVDRQVKWHGYRIELGEIEAALRQCPGVREAVVDLRQEQTRPPSLVAYLLAASDEALTPSQVRAFLQTRLPDYLLPAAFVLLPALPLTPNGKLDRQRLPAPEGQERLREPGEELAARTPIEQLLVRTWCEVLGLPRVGIQQNFFALGGDSIQVIQVCARLRSAGVLLSPRQFFQHQTIALLAARVSFSQEARSIVKEEPESGPVPLTPIQHWFFEQSFANPHYWNQARLLSVSAEEEVPRHMDRLRQCVAALLSQHDALRLCFTQTPQGWVQQVIDLKALFASTPLHELVQYRDLREIDPALQRAALEAEAIRLQKSLHLSNGPLLRVVCFELGEKRPSRLLIVVHHLLIDTVSWSILLSDLQALYRQLDQGSSLQLPIKTTSFPHWARALVRYAGSEQVLQESRYWLRASSHPGRRIPVDVEPAPSINTEASVNHVRSSLSLDETRSVLHEVHHAYHTQINDVLLAALMMAYRHWSGSSTLLIDLEWHGREPLGQEQHDLSRTIGWFTAMFPVELDITGMYQPGAVLPAIKEQLHRIPQHGIGYGLLRYLCNDEHMRAQLRTLPVPQISWNYLGQLDQRVGERELFVPAPETVGPVFAPVNQRPHLLDVLGYVSERQLHLTWLYSEQLHTRPTIERLAHYYKEQLRHLITHCQTPGTGRHTPSDFPELDLNQATLNKIADKMRKGKRS